MRRDDTHIHLGAVPDGESVGYLLYCTGGSESAGCEVDFWVVSSAGVASQLSLHLNDMTCFLMEAHISSLFLSFSNTLTVDVDGWVCFLGRFSVVILFFQGNL